MVITFSTRITVTFFTFCQFNTFLLRLSIDIYYFIWYILLLYSLYLFLSSSIYWIYSHIIGKIITIFFYFIFFFFFFFFYYYSWYINFTKRKNILNWFLVLSSPPITFHNIFQYLTFQYLYMLFLFLFSDILNHSILKRYFIIIVFSFIFMFLNVTLFRVCPTSSR